MVRSKRTANRPPGQSPQGPPGQTLVAVEHTEWAGPLPAPETLEEFDRIVRGSAQTIIDEWRAESEHRRRFERRALVLQGAEQIGGRLLAFLFAVAALGVTALSGDRRGRMGGRHPRRRNDRERGPRPDLRPEQVADRGANAAYRPRDKRAAPMIAPLPSRWTMTAQPSRPPVFRLPTGSMMLRSSPFQVSSRRISRTTLW